MPRIYVACLASYNNGTIYGAWIDAAQDPDDIATEIATMLRGSPTPGAEEYAIHDYEGFEGIRIREWEDLETLALHVRMTEEHGAAWAVYAGVESNPTDEGFRDTYQGAHDSREAFAESLADDIGLLANAPETLVNYFDWERYARDLFLGGDYWDARRDGVIHVFSNG